MINVGIVAPILAMRAGLRALLTPVEAASASPALQVIFETAYLKEDQPLPDGLDVLVTTSEAISPGLGEAVSQRPGQLSLLVLTDNSRILQTLSRWMLRSWGALSPEASPEELIAAVQSVNEGLWVASPALIQPLLSYNFITAEAGQDLQGNALTERESQVLQLLARGLANKQIASELNISEHTVKFHVSSIFARLGVTNRTEAVRLGVQRGLIAL